MCLPIIGGVISGIGAAMGAMSAKAQAQGQAAMDRRQAGIEAQTSAYKADRTQDDINRTTGQQRAGFAANGVGLSGSAAAIRWNSKLTQDNLKYKAKLNDMNAKQAGMAAPIAFLSPVISGIGTYSSSFGS